MTLSSGLATIRAATVVAVEVRERTDVTGDAGGVMIGAGSGAGAVPAEETGRALAVVAGVTGAAAGAARTVVVGRGGAVTTLADFAPLLLQLTRPIASTAEPIRVICRSATTVTVDRRQRGVRAWLPIARPRWFPARVVLSWFSGSDGCVLSSVVHADEE